MVKIWLCVTEDGQELLFDEKPHRIPHNRRTDEQGVWETDNDYPLNLGINLPVGTIKKLIGKELTWKSNPKCIEGKFSK